MKDWPGLQDDIQRMAYPVDLRRLSTPREQCLMATVGRVDESVVARAEAERFDQLPVLDKSGCLHGLVAVEHVRRLLDGGRELDISDSEIYLGVVDEHPSLFTLLAELSRYRALIYRDGGDSSTSAPEQDWFALVTISDLNRHAFRSYLYPILAELEASLAELIDRQFGDPWSWLSLMNEDGQVRVVGRWELEKRNSVETSPIAGAMLTDMIQIASKSKVLRDSLGYSSASQFKDAAGSIPVLRNQVMHPVRPLILAQEDVRTLQARLATIVGLTERVTAANAALAAQGLMSHRVLP